MTTELVIKGGIRITQGEKRYKGSLDKGNSSDQGKTIRRAWPPLFHSNVARTQTGLAAEETTISWPQRQHVVAFTLNLNFPTHSWLFHWVVLLQRAPSRFNWIPERIIRSFYQSSNPFLKQFGNRRVYWGLNEPDPRFSFPPSSTELCWHWTRSPQIHWAPFLCSVLYHIARKLVPASCISRPLAGSHKGEALSGGKRKGGREETRSS